ncbi:Serine/threonine-protein kinase haspin [Binucleata daphniae]
MKYKRAKKESKSARIRFKIQNNKHLNKYKIRLKVSEEFFCNSKINNIEAEMQEKIKKSEIQKCEMQNNKIDDTKIIDDTQITDKLVSQIIEGCTYKNSMSMEQSNSLYIESINNKEMNVKLNLVENACNKTVKDANKCVDENELETKRRRTPKYIVAKETKRKRKTRLVRIQISKNKNSTKSKINDDASTLDTKQEERITYENDQIISNITKTDKHNNKNIIENVHEKENSKTDKTQNDVLNSSKNIQKNERTDTAYKNSKEAKITNNKHNNEADDVNIKNIKEKKHTQQVCDLASKIQEDYEKKISGNEPIAPINTNKIVKNNEAKNIESEQTIQHKDTKQSRHVNTECSKEEYKKAANIYNTYAQNNYLQPTSNNRVECKNGHIKYTHCFDMYNKQYNMNCYAVNHNKRQRSIINYTNKCSSEYLHAYNTAVNCNNVKQTKYQTNAFPCVCNTFDNKAVDAYKYNVLHEECNKKNNKIIHNHYNDEVRCCEIEINGDNEQKNMNSKYDIRNFRVDTCCSDYSDSYTALEITSQTKTNITKTIRKHYSDITNKEKRRNRKYSTKKDVQKRNEKRETSIINIKNESKCNENEKAQKNTMHDIIKNMNIKIDETNNTTHKNRKPRTSDEQNNRAEYNTCEIADYKICESVDYKKCEIANSKYLREALNLRVVAFTSLPTKNIKKIGEATFSDVFMIDNAIYKIMPLTNNINDKDNLNINEFYKECFINKVLSPEKGIITLYDAFIVTGCYTSAYVEAFENYKDGENERPKKDMFGVLVMENGGKDLESFDFANTQEIEYFLKSLCCILYKLESKYNFEHRDMHWGNVMLKKKEDTAIRYTSADNVNVKNTSNDDASANNASANNTTADNGDEYNPFDINLIDFTLSRINYKDKIVHTNLYEKEWLFEGDEEEDMQYGIYNKMIRNDFEKKIKNETCAMNNKKDTWIYYNRFSNCYWFEYLVYKIEEKYGINSITQKYKKQLKIVKTIKTLYRKNEM